jgi:hypothetical protein
VAETFLIYPALNRILDQLFDRDVFLGSYFLRFFEQRVRVCR